MSLRRMAESVAFATLATAAPVAARTIPDDFLVTLERTACFGDCHVYTVTIDARGNVAGSSNQVRHSDIGRQDEARRGLRGRAGGTDTARTRGRRGREYAAMDHDDVDVITTLLELGVDANAPYGDGRFLPIVMLQSAAAARALISAGASVVARDERGESALGRAASLAPELTAVLLKAGAPADLQVNLEGATALIWAASLGNISAGSPGWSQDDSCRISTR